jgi:hypothetical protein
VPDEVDYKTRTPTLSSMGVRVLPTTGTRGSGTPRVLPSVLRFFLLALLFLELGSFREDGLELFQQLRMLVVESAGFR